MSAETVGTAGIVLLCSAEGTVREVIHDSVGLAPLVGRPFTQIAEPESLAKVEAFQYALGEQGAVLGWEINVAIDGATVCMALNGSTTPDGILVMGSAVPLGLYDEVTRLNNMLANLQRKMAKQNVAMDRLSALKDQFVGMAAHALQTPNGAISVLAEALLEELGPTLSEVHREYLETIQSSAEYMRVLAGFYLDAATIGTGAMRFTFAPTDLADVVNRSVRLHRTVSARLQEGLVLTVEGAGPLLMLDRGKIEEALHNLLNNAEKHSPAGAPVEVDLAFGDVSVCLTVTDHGLGIAPEDRVRMFQPYQVTGASKDKMGVGLGLSIVRRIVEGHGGDVQIEETPGGGATFIVTLPRRVAPSA
jgi:signal transduction histidine kinase